MKIKNNLAEKITASQNIITTLLMSLQVCLCVLAVFFQINIFILNFIVFMLNALFFILIKESINDKKKTLTMLRISMILFALSVVNLPLTVFKKSGLYIPIPLFFMTNISALFVMYFVSKKEFFNEKIEFLLNLELNALNEDKNKKVAGDVEVCRNLVTDKPVIIPKKDRYLHLLILGPTGSGKTSQVILPMLNQDMQNPEMGITVIEPKSDLAEKVYALAKINNRECVYFNPTSPDCPYFNPLYGAEDEVIENMATTFNMLNSDSQQYFKDMNEQLVRNSLKVLKRLKGNEATLVDLSRLIQNSGGVGRELVLDFSKLATTNDAISKENEDLASWFLNDYFKEKSKTYENTSGIRSQITKITSNSYLRRILNPPNGENDVDFDKHLANGGVLAITTAQGTLRDLGKFLGYFIILQFQSSVFRRPGNENTRPDHCLYIDEFQSYSNPGFSDMLTQGRSYRVASHLATQNRALIGMGSGKDGKSFIDLVSTNARNVILFPGANPSDADYYSKQFGEHEVVKVEKSQSRKRFNPLYGFDRLGYPSQTVRKVSKVEARFSPTDISIRPFGEITYYIIQKNSIQKPAAGIVTFLPIEIDDKINEIVKEYNDSRFKTKLPQDKNKQGIEDIEISFDEPAESIEISFDDPVEPIAEDYIIDNVIKEKKDNVDAEEEDFDIAKMYENSPNNENDEEQTYSDNREIDNLEISPTFLEDIREYNEEIDEDRFKDDDNDGFLPIFGDEEDFLI